MNNYPHNIDSEPEIKMATRVLYMEDDDGLRSITLVHLQRAGYQVDTAKDGEEGLALYDKGSYDILLVDQAMPKFSGLEVLRILAAGGPLPPVIMVTVEHAADVAVEALKLGAADYIIKDIAGKYLDILPAVIEQALDHRRLLREKEAAEEQLRQTRKMRAIGTLAGGIAHDFNNILAGIINYTTLLQQEGAQSESFQADLKKIEELAWRAAGLTRAILTFAREGKYQPQPLKINNLIENILPIIYETADKNIEIRFHPAGVLLEVIADPGQINQVILNLCLNGCEAMDKGGILTITTANRLPDGALLRSCPRLKGEDCISVSISDTGCGMDAETREQIYEPFFTTKPDRTGAGLGLSEAFGIVGGHGGCIDVESLPGRGSTFTVYLPAYRENQSVSDD